MAHFLTFIKDYQTLIAAILVGIFIWRWQRATEENIKRKEKLGIAADFLAEWSYGKSDTKRLNQLMNEITLWFPAYLYRPFGKMLSEPTNPEARSSKQLLIMVREHLGLRDGLQADEVIHFPKSTHCGCECETCAPNPPGCACC